jgi:alpha-amylase/alpha-mannosidase (GH57 family)
MVLPKNRYICIHGHFYQPPRENPWLEAIERQESAHPFHDWNEKIAEECYSPNAHARILDERGWLRKTVCNYELISFDFGPTLLPWLEEHAAETYHAIIEADRKSRKARSGHGNAIAQAYNHMIMPLASSRDKITQVVWGIKDFWFRFGRDPEGMWLPETAVDSETLEILARHGILFTVLAPRQARKFRASKKDQWVLVDGHSIDPSRPYRCNLRGGRSIVLFFYDGPVSQAIAFEDLLNSGDSLKNRLLAAFAERNWPQLVHVATDGESYGHHHKFGEMALAYALEKLQQEPSIQLTNYGELLEKHPPEAEAEFIESSSWSCAHGVGRWKEDCGCSVSQRPGWSQKWRTPLRSALDLVRDRVDAIYLQQSAALLRQPWEARDRYISVILARDANLPLFLREQATKELTAAETRTALSLLEMQRNRMLMYTSCGWFFDDITGIESLQVLAYAARVLQLASAFEPDLTKEFLGVLSLAVSNVRPNPRGDEVFVSKVVPQKADLVRVAAHVGMFSVFDHVPVNERFYCYDVTPVDFSRHESGDRVLLVGRIVLRSRITTESRELVTAVIYLGGVDFRCSVADFMDAAAYSTLKADLTEVFLAQSSTELIRKLDTYFPGEYYSIGDLFYEQRAEILKTLTEKMYQDQAALFEGFYRKNKGAARLMMDRAEQIPDTFFAAAGFVLNRSLVTEVEKLAGGFFPDGLESLIKESRFWRIHLDTKPAEQLIRRRITDLVKELDRAPFDGDRSHEIFMFLELCRELDISVDLGEAQIVLFEISRRLAEELPGGLPPYFSELGARLAVRLA